MERLRGKGEGWEGKRNIGNYGSDRELGREIEGEGRREGEGRESMEGLQIKKWRIGEYKEGKGWSSLPLHILKMLSKIREFFVNSFPNSYKRGKNLVKEWSIIFSNSQTYLKISQILPPRKMMGNVSRNNILLDWQIINPDIICYCHHTIIQSIKKYCQRRPLCFLKCIILGIIMHCNIDI